jgi:glycosyltransferase involved in cell wall biosynthesis
MTPTPLKIFTTIPHGSTASWYYRLAVPLHTTRDLGLPVRVLIDSNDSNVPTEERQRAFCEADLILLYQPIGEGPIHNLRGVQSLIPSKREDGWKWPPAVVVETDDNLFNVSPFNPAFKNLGIRDMNGQDIPVGHHIGIVSNGEKTILFKDGEQGFSVSRNRQVIASYRRILEMVDAVSCSTEPVAESVRKEATPRRVKVWPNLVRFNDYEQVDLRDDPKQVKILWQGGAAHYEDWFPLREVLGRLTERYPQVHWIIWGAQYPWVNELMPAHRYTYKNWCIYEEYRLRLALIGHDISLAPLSDHIFNNCRSAIKFYEASVLKKDIPTLAQRTGAYKQEIVDGETGLLFGDPEEFECKLSMLIEDETERKRIGRNAKDWVHEHRDAMKEVPKMVQWWEQLRDERRLEQPRVGDAEWAEIEAQDRAEQANEMQTAAALS